MADSFTHEYKYSVFEQITEAEDEFILSRFNEHFEKIGESKLSKERLYRAVYLLNQEEAGCLQLVQEAEWTANAVGVYRCSHCHANMRLRKKRKPLFCEVCGCKMRNGGE